MVRKVGAGVWCCVGFLLGAGAACAQRTEIPLDHGWEFRQVGADAGLTAEPQGAAGAQAGGSESGEGTERPAGAAGADGADRPWRPAQVPGDVHLDLLRNGLIADPFYRDNEAKLQWIEGAGWEYKTAIQATPEMLRRRNVELVFDGLDAYAEVYVNGTPVLTANNMFRTWRVDVRSVLHAGSNELRVVFPSPDKAAARAAAADPWRLKTHVEDKTYVRKAAYEYGWDWGPTFVTSGIWRVAHLEMWDSARISDLHVRQLDVTAAVAHLNAETEVNASEDGPAEVSLSYARGGHPTEISRQVMLHAGVNHVEFPIEVTRPELWWPAGYGAQPLYTFTATVKMRGMVQDTRSRRTGLRSIVLRRELDQWGRSFEFVVNGVPVFAKGADVIPFDSFPDRVTEADYRRILGSAKDANMNMIRLWGGGYYETDQFYDLCDELGLMVWQDFMFGNDWQPGLYSWKLNVAAEIEDQVRRLRDHPSIAIWSGNNETEEALAWKGRDKLPADVRFQMWQDYVSTFSGVIPNVVERLDPERPYWPSSPSSDYEATSETFQSGDAHIWDVWHGRVPFSTYETHHPRFVTEYGFQSFPEMKTIEAFTLPEDRTSIFTPVMLDHQKNNEGNSIIQDYLLKDYAEPKDFASFLYVSQVLQAEGIKLGAEHFRRERPRTMGSIFWQLNDCWPVASWSSIDYYGRWKALQYYARRFYAPVLVSPVFADGGLSVWVVSDKTAPEAATLRMRVMTMDGTVLEEKSQEVTVEPLASRMEMSEPMTALLAVKGFAPAKTVIAVDLSVGGEVVSSNLAYPLPTKQMQLEKAALRYEVARDGTGYAVTVTSDKVARDVHVSFDSLSPHLSDDYFDLLPGEKKTVRFEAGASLEEVKGQMHVMSLSDAFGPGAGMAAGDAHAVK